MDNQYPTPPASEPQYQAGEDYTSQFTAAEINEAKVMTILGYLGILFLLPLLVYPKNRYSKFHANQGLLVFIMSIVVMVVVTIISQVSALMGLALNFLYLAPLMFAIIGIINAAGNKAKTLPLIGGVIILK